MTSDLSPANVARALEADEVLHWPDGVSETVVERLARPPRMAVERDELERERNEARATLAAFEEAIGRAGRIWRVGDGRLFVLDSESDLDPAEFLPEGAVELVPAGPCSQCGATS